MQFVSQFVGRPVVCSLCLVVAVVWIAIGVGSIVGAQIDHQIGKRANRLNKSDKLFAIPTK